MRTTAILNLKGGVAKTVTTVNMAAILARDYKARVLLIDADCQCNCTEFSAVPPIRGHWPTSSGCLTATPTPLPSAPTASGEPPWTGST